MESYAIYLAEKNNQIESLHNEILKIRNSASSNIEQKEQKLQKLLDSHLMTDDNWKTFKNIFTENYPIFYQNLSMSFNDLTESHLRLITLTKIGLTNNEIASLLGISIDAVKKSKQRLRKKFGEKADQIF